jgi:hypothetical protein
VTANSSWSGATATVVNTRPVLPTQVVQVEPKLPSPGWISRSITVSSGRHGQLNCHQPWSWHHHLFATGALRQVNLRLRT